jgi:hypothetical protein
MIKILELSKNYCKKYYNNDYKKMIKELDGVLFDDNSIKKSFNFSNGTFKHLMNYISSNRNYAKFYDLINKKYI